MEDLTDMTRGIIFAHSDMTEGAEPLYVLPPTLDETLVHQIAIKAATLVFTTVDLSIDFEGASLFQFPDKGITVLVYYFLFSLEDNETEKQIPATISLLIESEYDWFFLKEIKPLVQRIARIVRRIKEAGEIVIEEFRELYKFLNTVYRRDEELKNTRIFSAQALKKPVYISDPQGFLDYYPYVNLDLGDQVISQLIDGDSTIAELSTILSASSFEILPIIQRLFRYKLIALQNNATRLEFEK
jgi:hypothetical protein